MQNPINLIDPSGMEPEEGGGDPPTTKPSFRGIINVDNVLKGKKWIDYNLVGDCNASARQQNRESGKSKVEPDGAGYQTNMFIDKARQNQSKEKTPEVDLQKGVDVVINNLKDGKPVMAGVMYERKAGADHELGVSSNDNNNVATNHYITIVGMGVEEGGFPYFSYVFVF